MQITVGSLCSEGRQVLPPGSLRKDKAAAGKPGAQHTHGDHAAAPAAQRTERGKQWPLRTPGSSKELGKTEGST